MPRFIAHSEETIKRALAEEQARQDALPPEERAFAFGVGSGYMADDDGNPIPFDIGGTPGR